MEWVSDGQGWWDLDTGDAWAASYQLLDGLKHRVGDNDARWVVLWHGGFNEEYLHPDEYTEDQVRNHIELKYKLLRGEHG
jgi:hypothetical protein